MGFSSVFQILLAYILNIISKLNNNYLTFILLNLIGAIMTYLASVLIKYIPFIIQEGI
ncbi:CBU_0592 family membrane protein [Tenacibaculum ovolyticum]